MDDIPGCPVGDRPGYGARAVRSALNTKDRASQQRNLQDRHAEAGLYTTAMGCPARPKRMIMTALARLAVI